jgi:hypothetical protein
MMLSAQSSSADAPRVRSPSPSGVRIEHDVNHTGVSTGEPVEFD